MAEFECRGCGARCTMPAGDGGEQVRTCELCGQVLVMQQKDLATMSFMLGLCSFVPLVGVALGAAAIAVGVVDLCKSASRAAWKGIAWGVLGGFVFQAVLFGYVVPIFLADSAGDSAGNSAGDFWRDNGVRRAVCSSRLETIGKGMVAYASVNDEAYPMRSGAIEPTTANNLWLLVVEGNVPAQSFVCPSVEDEQNAGQPLTEGPKPGTGTTTFSYSYQSGIKGTHYVASLGDSNGLAIVADRTNAQAGIHELSLNHSSAPPDDRGVNVLYPDAHVEWSETSNAGVDGDNIYTSAGTVRTNVDGDLTSPRTSMMDSFLVGP